MADVDEDPTAEGGAPSNDQALKEEKDEVPDECADKENVSEPVPVVEGGDEGERGDGGGIEATEGAVEGEEGDGGEGAEGEVCVGDEGETADGPVCDEMVSILSDPEDICICHLACTPFHQILYPLHHHPR